MEEAGKHRSDCWVRIKLETSKPSWKPSSWRATSCMARTRSICAFLVVFLLFVIEVVAGTVWIPAEIPPLEVALFSRTP